uniref:Uncharacterized protein n=1 Tax=Physcomitrium patens TaxID=3218 RepID=A0A2K1JD45_PHYPA|nr:hypothetical protein PHYPA_019717 [Physcomitrium patens]
MASKRRVIYDLNPLNVMFTPITDTFQFSGSKGKSPIPSAGKKVGISYKAENGIKYPLILAPKGCMFYLLGIQDDSFSGSSNKGSKNTCISISVENNKDTNENAFCANVHAIYDHCKEYIIKHPKDVGIKVSKDTIDDMFKHPLKEFTKDGITIMRMYAKLIVSNKDSKVWTIFCNTKQEKVDSKSLEGTHYRMYPALLFDSLYFWSGSRASLQCKLSKAVVELVDRATPSLDMSLFKIKDEKDNV